MSDATETKVLEPIRYWITEERTPRRWRSDKIEYWLNSSRVFVKLGPFADRDEAERMMAVARKYSG